MAGADDRWSAPKPRVPDDRTVSVEPVTRKDGSRAWKSRWRENGRERARTFALKRDADAWDRELARRKQLGPLAVQHLTRRDGETLGEWIEQRWIPEHGVTAGRQVHADALCGASTRVHIAPTLDSKCRSARSTVSRLRAWQAELIKSRRQRRNHRQGTDIPVERSATRSRERSHPWQSSRPWCAPKAQRHPGTECGHSHPALLFELSSWCSS